MLSNIKNLNTDSGFTVLENGNVAVTVVVAGELITKKSDIFSKLIGWYKSGRYCHVETIIGNNWISARLKDGVHIKQLEELRSNYDYFTLDNIIVTIEQLEKIDRFLGSIKNAKYDWLGIFGAQILPLKYDDGKSYFCSEISILLLQLFLVEPVLGLKSEEIDPNKEIEIISKIASKIKSQG